MFVTAEQQGKTLEVVGTIIMRGDLIDGRTLSPVVLVGLEVSFDEDAQTVKVMSSHEAMATAWDPDDDIGEDRMVSRTFVTVIDESGNASSYEEH